MSECPVCGSDTFRLYHGEWDSGGAKMTPDEGTCDECGFTYSEHIKHPMKEQVGRYQRVRAEAAESREQDLIAENARLVELVAELRGERAILTDRGIDVSERVCSSCGRHLLSYRDGDTICPECNARGRVEDLERIAALDALRADEALRGE